ncbi:hypothetical protein WN48_03404 [Eufriesea mexicana]|uniref:Uncharacterized protein n=1 Tax=Eufriesea mexicana TaxID=516756 RepID=A0A310SPG4_9HYME|nr:hypothetical protein WN48_03404 [Eufriesea mexicana]
MSGKLKIYINSQETTISNSLRTRSVPSVKTTCCELFLSCFRIIHKRKSIKNIMNNNVKEYDYVVEKLIVNRVPFILFSIPKSTVECKINSKSKRNSNNNVLESLTKLNTIYSPETQSLLYYSDRFDQNILSLNTANKCSHFNTNTAILNEKIKKCTLFKGYHTKITEFMNVISNLCLDLEEHEKLPKDPCFFNIIKSMNVISTKMSLKGFLKRNNHHEKEKAFKSRIFIQEPFLKKRESSEIKPRNKHEIYNVKQMEYVSLNDYQDNFVSKNKKPIAKSVHEISYNSANFVKSIINIHSINAEDNKPINNHLKYNHQFLINRTKILSENIANSNPLILRWNIIIKHYKGKTYSSNISQKMNKYFNIN